MVKAIVVLATVKMQQQHSTATKVEVEEALIGEIGSCAVSKKRNKQF